jgi:hypothetical protein
MTASSLEEKMQSQTEQMVCGQKSTAAFVRLGGQVQYDYKTADSHPIATTLVTSCK